MDKEGTENPTGEGGCGMTLEEAIEILKSFHDQAACTLDAVSALAFRLGIKALERWRSNYLIPQNKKGETDYDSKGIGCEVRRSRR